MTREEQIENAARHYSIKASEDSWNRPDWEDVEWAFEVGAEWADANPQWHKYPDEKPAIRQWYNVYLENGAIIGAYYGTDYVWHESDMDTRIIDSWNSNVIAWIELPQSPKF